jgi:hypothetical protein
MMLAAAPCHKKTLLKTLLKTPPGKKTTPRGKSDSAFAMKEILLQLGHLTCTVQRMSDESIALTDNQKQQNTELALLKKTVVSKSKPSDTPGLPATPLARGPVQHVPQVPPPVYSGEAAFAQQGINSTLELPIPLPNGARISRKTFLAAHSGEYINLPEFAPNSEPSAVMESVIDEATGNLVFKSKTVKKAIDCFLSWARAWAGYESLLIEMNHTLYQCLSDYRLFIQSCDATYHWPAVTSYDQRHRHRTSMAHSVDFTACSTDIYVVTLNANTIRPTPKSCYSCGSLYHNIKDCPFQKRRYHTLPI